MVKACIQRQAVTTIACPGRYRTKYSTQVSASWFGDHSAPDPPFDARSGFSRGMPRSFISGAETRGRAVDGRILHLHVEEKRPVGCGRPQVSIPSSYTKCVGENTGLPFSYSIIMIPSPPHRNLQLGLRGRGSVKAFRKDAVIVILPLIPR